jgi:hypothetical protein
MFDITAKTSKAASIHEHNSQVGPQMEEDFLGGYEMHEASATPVGNNQPIKLFWWPAG